MANEDLQQLSKELVERLSKEAERNVPASTAHVGGVVKAAALLEKLLRAVVLHVARTEGVHPEDLLSPLGGAWGKKPELGRAMLGPLSEGLRRHFVRRTPDTLSPMLRPLVADLTRNGSVIYRFKDLRNAIAKDGTEPAAAVPAMRALRDVILDVRREAGWS